MRDHPSELAKYIQTWLDSEPSLKRHFKVVSGRPDPVMTPNGPAQSSIEDDKIVCSGGVICAYIYDDYVHSLAQFRAGDPQFFEKLKAKLFEIHDDYRRLFKGLGQVNLCQHLSAYPKS